MDQAWASMVELLKVHCTERCQVTGTEIHQLYKNASGFNQLYQRLMNCVKCKRKVPGRKGEYNTSVIQDIYKAIKE